MTPSEPPRSAADPVSSQLAQLRAMPPLAAVVTAARVAAAAAVPRLRGEMPAGGLDSPSRAPRRWDGRDVVGVGALLTAMCAAALVLPSPRGGGPALTAEGGLLWTGLCAAVSALSFALLERRRVDMYTLGAQTRTAPRLYVFFSVLWAIVLVWCVTQGALRFPDWPQTSGAVLLVAALVTLVSLAVVARRRDRTARTDPRVAAKDAWGRTRDDVDPVTEWWTRFPDRLTAGEREVARGSFERTLEVLVGERIIRPGVARRLRRKGPRAVWAGDAS